MMGERLDALQEHDPDAAARVAEKMRRYVLAPHPGQQQVIDELARFGALCAGRRWGKTRLGAKVALREARKQKRVVWWIANTYKNVRRGYRAVLAQTPPSMLAKPAPPATADGRQILHLRTGTRIEFYSAENPDAMVGEGVNFAILDECALYREHVWSQVIRPTLMDTRGGALLISTPRGQNWFKQMHDRGSDAQFPDWASWRFPSHTNPFLHPDELAELEDSLPAALYEQEVLAQFVSNAASWFRFGEDRVSPLVPPAEHVAMGVDLAKHRDFTVITADRVEDGRPCYHDRFKDVSWPLQRERIKLAAQKIRAAGAELTIGIDATGLGDVVYDDLIDDGLDVVPLKFGSGDWKMRAARLLSADLERGRAFVLDEQRAEFDAYRYEITSSGGYRLSAPDSSHDDEVSAKLISHWIRNQSAPPTIDIIGGEIATEAQTSAVVREIVPEPPSVAELMNRPGAWR